MTFRLCNKHIGEIDGKPPEIFVQQLKANYRNVSTSDRRRVSVLCFQSEPAESNQLGFRARHYQFSHLSMTVARRNVQATCNVRRE